MLFRYAESVDIRAFQRLYVDTYLAICGHLPCKIFQYVDTYLASTDKKNIVHKTAFTLQRFVCLELIY